MRWSPVRTWAVRRRGTRRWSYFRGVSHRGWWDHEPSECLFVKRVTEGICVHMPLNGWEARSRGGWRMCPPRQVGHTRANFLHQELQALDLPRWVVSILGDG